MFSQQLNKLFENKWLEIDFDNHYIVSHRQFTDYKLPKSQDYPGIIQYPSNRKPWDNLGIQAYRNVWWYYLAIFLGLFLGKTVGISLFPYVAIRVKLCAWPEGMNLPRLISLAVLGGIGFTVSLFLANLAYDGPEMAQLLNEAKLGIFAGTIVSGVVGYMLLSRFLPKGEAK